MHSTISLHLLLLSAYYSAGERKTAISVKQQYRDHRPHIFPNPKNYLDIVFESNVFVDKSLLIKEILEVPDRLISINRPRYWGKTINLDMLQTFFEIPVDLDGKQIVPRNSSCYRYFSTGQLTAPTGESESLRAPPLISRHPEIIDTFLGKHPVIYLDFNNMKATNSTELMQAFIHRIGDAFRRHRYLLKKYWDTVKDNNANAIDKTLSQSRHYKMTQFVENKVEFADELISSMNFLGELLYRRFDALLFVMIDGYDAFYTQVLSAPQFEESEKQKFINFYSHFIRVTFKTVYCIKKGILTSVLPIPHQEYSHHLSGTAEFTFLDSELAEFYGFDEWEVDTIIEYINLPKNIHQLDAYYGGYQFRTNASKIYNPFSITHHSSNGTNPWIDLDKLRNYVRFFVQSYKPEFLKLFADAFSDSGVPLRASCLNDYKFSWAETKFFLRAFDVAYDDKYRRELLKFDIRRFTHQIIFFLYLHGYFTVTEGFSPSSSTVFIQMKCPNAAVRKEMTAMVNEFIKKSQPA